MATATETKKKALKTSPKTALPADKQAPKVSKKAPKTPSNSFAVITTGGKQYRVSEGQRLKIEKIAGDHKEGDVVPFKNVLLKSDGTNVSIGTPFISGSTVTSTLIKIGRYKTIDVIKYKQKSRYFKKYGHRQPYFEVRIDSIS